MTALSALTRFARPEGRETPQAGERCELCAAELGFDHRHVVDLEHRAICCACRPCALLFEHPGAARGRYRTVPHRIAVDPEFTLTEEDWAALEIPVRLAFVFFNSSLDRWVAMYPSPAGATESELSLPAWADLGKRSRLIREATPDVEAVLVYGGRTGEPFETFLVPIDACYALVAQMRSHWKGFDGGPALRRALCGFFDDLRRRSKALADGRGGKS